jgi:hypothetical protein
MQEFGGGGGCLVGEGCAYTDFDGAGGKVCGGKGEEWGSGGGDRL